MTDDVPLFEIAWDGADVTNAVDSITRGSYWANGPYVDEFEASLETYLDVEHAVTVNSGTTALVAALEALGVSDGDEVIVPSFTFIATANAVRLVGADPVFVDIEADRYGLDPAAVEEAITDDTAAVIPVHYAGGACDIDGIETVAETHDVAVVEDAAEAFGADLDGRTLGTIGDLGVLSFCQNKVVATGEGGAIVTDDSELARELRLISSHGRASGDYFESAGGGDYVRLGTNYRMPDVVAAIGCAQMEKVAQLVERRRRAAGWYADVLESVDDVTLPVDPADGHHVYQLYPVTFDRWVDRDAVSAYLRERGVASKVYFDPVHSTNYYRETPTGRSRDLQVTESVSRRVLSLPIFPDIERETVERVAETVKGALDDQRA